MWQWSEHMEPPTIGNRVVMLLDGGIGHFGIQNGWSAVRYEEIRYCIGPIWIQQL
jgi:hypothetical protein